MLRGREPHRTLGYTLIEVLLVITILGVLIALLLPAVQAAREAARRAKCLSQIRQLSAALSHYNLTHGVLPSGTVDPNRPIANVPQGYHHNWIVQILPYFDSEPIYDSFNLALDVYDNAQQTARMTSISFLVCPSEPNLPPAGDPPHSNYAGCHHHTEAPIDVTNTGMLYLNSSIRPERIPDGLTQTILIGEKRLDMVDLGWASGTRATLRNTGTPPNGFFLAAPRFAAPNRRPTLTLTPTSVGGYSSMHPGGINAGFADGSIKFIKSTVAIGVFEAMGHRMDDQTIDSQSY